jgi:hypothetical protein
MLLTDQQWVQLESIFAKVTLDSHGRKAFLIPIARSVRMDAANAPFAEWLDIPGDNDFVVIMRYVIQKAQEPALEKALLQGLQSRALNQQDQDTLTSWLESPTQHQRPPDIEITDDVIQTLSISQGAQKVLRQSIQLFEKNANARKQFVIDTISNALSCAKDLASNLKNLERLNLSPNANGEDIAKKLVENDLPVKLLDDIVDHWSRVPIGNKFIAEDASEFHLIKEILVMESLPAEDRSQFRHALLEANDHASSPGPSSELDVTVHKEDGRMLDYIEKLVRQTWLSLTMDQERLSEALRILLSQRKADLHERTRLLSKVRFVTEPSEADDNQYRNGLTPNSIAEHLINALAGRVRKVENPLAVLTRDLDRMSREKVLVVMTVADKRERLSYLDLLKQSFPSVQPIGLSPYEGDIYAQVTHHLEWIEKKIPREYVMKLDDGPAHR